MADHDQYRTVLWRGRNYFDDATRWREVAPEVALPESFRYTETPAPGKPAATLHMRFTDGKLTCEKVELEPQRGVPLTSVTLRRVPLGRMLREAPLHAAQGITFDAASPHTYGQEIRVVPLPNEEQIIETTAWLRSDPRIPRRDPVLSDPRLADVVERMKAGDSLGEQLAKGDASRIEAVRQEHIANMAQAIEEGPFELSPMWLQPLSPT